MQCVDVGAVLWWCWCVCALNNISTVIEARMGEALQTLWFPFNAYGRSLFDFFFFRNFVFEIVDPSHPLAAGFDGITDVIDNAFAVKPTTAPTCVLFFFFFWGGEKV